MWVPESMRKVQFQDNCLSSDTILCCKDLPYDCKENDLRNLFDGVCRSGVRRVQVYRGRGNQPLGYAFVELFSADDVEAANGIDLFGRTIIIERFQFNPKPKSTNFENLHVKFERSNPEGSIVTENDLRQALQEYGNLSNVAVRKQHKNDKGCWEGYGFASFEDPTTNSQFFSGDANVSKHIDDILFTFKLSKKVSSALAVAAPAPPTSPVASSNSNVDFAGIMTMDDSHSSSSSHALSPTPQGPRLPLYLQPPQQLATTPSPPPLGNVMPMSPVYSQYQYYYQPPQYMSPHYHSQLPRTPYHPGYPPVVFPPPPQYTQQQVMNPYPQQQFINAQPLPMVATAAVVPVVMVPQPFIQPPMLFVPSSPRSPRVECQLHYQQQLPSPPRFHPRPSSPYPAPNNCHNDAQSSQRQQHDSRYHST